MIQATHRGIGLKIYLNMLVEDTPYAFHDISLSEFHLSFSV